MNARYTVSPSGDVQRIYTRSGSGGYIPAQVGRTEGGRQAVKRILLEGYIQCTNGRGVTRYERLAVRGTLEDSQIVATLANHLQMSETLVRRYLTV